MKFLICALVVPIAACAGKEGAIGPDGARGPTGPAGEQGPTGPAGPAGVQGPTGPQGPVGPQGPAGPMGLQGPAGAVGPQGIRGPVGMTGPLGAPGPQGVIGPAGPPGPVGPQGAVGPAGPVGPPALPDTGCPGSRVEGVCLVDFSNHTDQDFQSAALVCASMEADLCTDSQMWPLSVGSWQNQMLVTTMMTSPHWTASFADDDSSQWYGVSNGVGDDHDAFSGYGWACCGGTTPIGPRITPEVVNGVSVYAVHDEQNVMWPGAVGYCHAIGTDLCSDSQTAILRQAGRLTVATWTNSHSDNDGNQWYIANGGTSDDPSPGEQYGFACCGSTLPADLSCPVPRTLGVCATTIHDQMDTDFMSAAQSCANDGADLCSMSQAAALRAAGALTVGVWTNSHSDNDSGTAYPAIGDSMPDNPDPSDQFGYACCRK